MNHAINSNTRKLPKADSKISFVQLMSLLAFSALFSLTVPLYNTTSAEFNMSRFVTFGISTLLIFSCYIPLMFAQRSVGEQNLFKAKSSKLFLKVLKWFLGCIIILRMLYIVLYTSLQLNEFISQTILAYLTPIFFVLVTFSVIWYGSIKGIQATARIAGFALIMFLTVILLSPLMVLQKLEFVRLYSPFASFGEMSGESIFMTIFNDIIRCDELFFFAALAGFVRSRKNEQTLVTKSQSHKSVLYYLPIVLLSAFWLNLLYNTVLGRFLSNVIYPLYTISTFATLNVLERLDGLFVTAAIIGGVLKVTLAFICIRIVLAELIHFDMKSHKPFAKITTSILVVLSAVTTVFFIGNENLFESMVVKVFLACALVIIAFILPITVAILQKTQHNQKKGKSHENKTSTKAVLD
ncbi:MAG: spore germination protein [Oscillospiraceae bacterium]|nr:spore germination protein [Oscillospiraceae bacterium]